MHFAALAILSSLVASAAAHTRVWGVWVNGVDQGDGRDIYIRSPPTNDPVVNLTDPAMACNVDNRVVPQWVSVKSNDSLTFEWYHNTRDDDIIASSHHGPIAVYVAPAASNGSGPVWVKIFDDTYTTSWAVDRLITAHGQHTVIVPDIPAGDYLFRAEINALHQADVLYDQDPLRGAQFYISCAQITITPGGDETLPAGIALPGAYTDSTPGIVWNLYNGSDPTEYVAPGPPVWTDALGGSIALVGIPVLPNTTSSAGVAPTGAA
ncbi:glycoside hydrolase family 61 protein [Phanerochaete carnosa HHB-10118-sp]|uniref:AA9 family lytic polysaccharide monooxygenase A n=1 Tax=Phanerochaete carnosa (strain HHB-10118-sp) TaxID=650164 RepID=LP9A_PHACS|nr:glycoside hydrolase family 61 protein [Phanerochaete carnosa HHB-10118-sp]EKM52808.1 glycoside hydrolase family 61 protein [Phanerochaete carnosa HHB-10118-sp]